MILIYYHDVHDVHVDYDVHGANDYVMFYYTVYHICHQFSYYYCFDYYDDSCYPAYFKQPK